MTRSNAITNWVWIAVRAMHGWFPLGGGNHRQRRKQTLTARNIIIASGAAPLVPPFPGLEQIDYLTTETLWKIRDNPGRLLFSVAAPSAVAGQAFARLGTSVTQVEMLPRILPREDDDAAKLVADALRRDGVELLLGHRADRFAVEGGDKVLYTQHQGKSVRMVFDQILIAIGRKANTDGLGLEALGITTNKNGTIVLNAFLQTAFPTFMLSAMWPVPTSSPTLLPTRPGMPPSMHCSAALKNSGWITQ